MTRTKAGDEVLNRILTAWLNGWKIAVSVCGFWLSSSHFIDIIRYYAMGIKDYPEVFSWFVLLSVAAPIFFAAVLFNLGSGRT